MGNAATSELAAPLHELDFRVMHGEIRHQHEDTCHMHDAHSAAHRHHHHHYHHDYFLVGVADAIGGVARNARTRLSERTRLLIHWALYALHLAVFASLVAAVAVLNARHGDGVALSLPLALACALSLVPAAAALGRGAALPPGPLVGAPAAAGSPCAASSPLQSGDGEWTAGCAAPAEPHLSESSAAADGGLQGGIVNLRPESPSRTVAEQPLPQRASPLSRSHGHEECGVASPLCGAQCSAHAQPLTHGASTKGALLGPARHDSASAAHDRRRDGYMALAPVASPSAYQVALLWCSGLGLGVFGVLGSATALVAVLQTVPADEPGELRAFIAAAAVGIACSGAFLCVFAAAAACARWSAASATVLLRRRRVGSFWDFLAALYSSSGAMLLINVYGIVDLSATGRIVSAEQVLYIGISATSLLLEVAQALFWDEGTFEVHISPDNGWNRLAVIAAMERCCQMRVAATEGGWHSIKFFSLFAVIFADVLLACGLIALSVTTFSGYSTVAFVVVDILESFLEAQHLFQTWAGALYRRGDYHGLHALQAAADAPCKYLSYNGYRLVEAQPVAHMPVGGCALADPNMRLALL